MEKKQCHYEAKEPCVTSMCICAVFQMYELTCQNNLHYDLLVSWPFISNTQTIMICKNESCSCTSNGEFGSELEKCGRIS